jgi:hypothetical protein
MDFTRTKDLDHVYKILTCPAIYRMMGDDYLPPPEKFQVNDHPDIWYVIIGTSAMVGLFCLFPQNSICWDLHAAILPWASKHEKREAGRDLVPWLYRNTECRRLTASVPASNRQAIVYGTHAIGMKYVGRQEKAFLRNGKLQDLVILGRSVEGRDCVPGQRLSAARSACAERHTAEINAGTARCALLRA